MSAISRVVSWSQCYQIVSLRSSRLTNRSLCAGNTTRRGRLSTVDLLQGTLTEGEGSVQLTSSRESLLKGKAQYNWTPPGSSYWRIRLSTIDLLQGILTEGEGSVKLTSSREFLLKGKGQYSLPPPGNPYWRGRLSIVDLHELTRLDQLLLILKT